MSAPLPASVAGAVEVSDQFVISHGKGGAVGVFTASASLALRRGDRVVVQSVRGVEVGAVLCAATDRKAKWLGAVAAGRLLRSFTSEDDAMRAEFALREREMFETVRAWSARDGVAIEVLDIELLFDGSAAIVQFVGEEKDTEAFAHALETQLGLAVRMENLTAPATHEEEHHGCDKPDCGREAGGGGCTTCSTGGGCSTCGSSKVDLKEYFGHLRTKMEEKHRIPLA